jgi:hypothetical protein
VQRLTFIATRRSLENLPFHFPRPLPDLREKSRIRGERFFRQSAATIKGGKFGNGMILRSRATFPPES